MESAEGATRDTATVSSRKFSRYIFSFSFPFTSLCVTLIYEDEKREKRGKGKMK